MGHPTSFSWQRFVALAVKEFTQMQRDRLTFAMMVGIPLMQLMLFGFAINSDPKHLPTAVLLADQGPQARSLVQAIRNSGYYDIVGTVTSQSEADALLDRGEVQFVIHIPEDFSRRLWRGEKASVLVEADATDPGATGSAVSALRALAASALSHDARGPLGGLVTPPPPLDLLVHARYNPEAITQFNIVPGLMGVVLTMTMVMITSLAITRERERGTMENLLSMPVRPLEVMTGKIIPYILVGFIQVSLILIASHVIFHVPMAGSLALLYVVTSLFITTNLAVGITFSTVAQNQLQAVQMSFFFFLPSLLLSGFMFPFRGMPVWAQAIGEVFPLTHFLRAVRGIMLKGNGIGVVAGHLWPVAGFMVVALFIGMKRYRQTLD